MSDNRESMRLVLEAMHCLDSAMHYAECESLTKNEKAVKAMRRAYEHLRKSALKMATLKSEKVALRCETIELSAADYEE